MPRIRVPSIALCAKLDLLCRNVVYLALGRPRIATVQVSCITVERCR